MDLLHLPAGPPGVIVLVGLPGSGKSTFASALAKANAKVVIVNNDSLSTMFAGGQYAYQPGWSRLLQETTKLVIQESLLLGLSVIVDNCNHTFGARRRLYSIAETQRAPVQLFQMPLLPNAGHAATSHAEVHRRLLRRRMLNARGCSEKVWAEALTKMISEYEPLDTEPHVFDCQRTAVLRVIAEDLLDAAMKGAM